MDKEVKEAEVLFDHLFNLRTFTSGRTLYMGGTEVVEKYPCPIIIVPLLILRNSLI